MPPSSTEHLVFFVSDRVLGGKHIFMAHLAGALVEGGHRVTLAVQKDGQFFDYLTQRHNPAVQTIEIDLDNEHAAIGATRDYLTTAPRPSVVFATGRHDAQVLEAVRLNAEGMRWGAFRHSGFPLPQDSPAGRYYDACSLLVLTSQRQIDIDFSHIPDERKHLMRSTVPAGWKTQVEQARRSSSARPRTGLLRVVYTGRLSWEKGLGRAIAAVADQIDTEDCLELQAHPNRGCS